MANPNILQPQDRLVDSQGLVTRSWWRYFNGLGSSLGTLTNTVSTNAATAAAAAAGNQVTVGGGLSITGDPMIFITPIPPGTLFGNTASTAESPSEVALDPSTLFFNGNTLTVVGLGSAQGSGVGASFALAETVAYWGM